MYRIYCIYIPELHHFASDAERLLVLKAAKQHVLKEKTYYLIAWFVLIFFLGGLFIAVLGNFVQSCFTSASIPRLYILIPLKVIAWGILLYVWWSIIWNKLLRRRVKYELAKHGIHLCVQCGYILKGLPNVFQSDTLTIKCPECGSIIDKYRMLTEWKRRYR